MNAAIVFILIPRGYGGGSHIKATPQNLMIIAGLIACVIGAAVWTYISWKKQKR